MPPPSPLTQKALVFTGTSGCYVDLPNIGGASTFAAFTIELWLKMSSTAGDGGGDPIALWLDIVSVRPASSNRVKVDAVYDRTGGTGDLYLSDCTSTTLSVGVWYHLAISVASRSSYPQVYLDGSLQSCNNGVSSHGGTYHADLIGAHSVSNANTATTSPGGGYRFRGEMTDIRIWSVARTSSQIANNMRALVPSAEAGLEANFLFSDDTGVSGSVCNDAVGSYSGQYVGTCTVRDYAPLWPPSTPPPISPPPPLLPAALGGAPLLLGTASSYGPSEPYVHGNLTDLLAPPPSPPLSGDDIGDGEYGSGEASSGEEGSGSGEEGSGLG